MAAFFTSPEQEAAQLRVSVGLADLSYYWKFDLRKHPQRQCWTLGANHYLVTGEPPLDVPPDATDVTSGFANLCLAGPKSRDVLGKLTSLNVTEFAFPNLRCAQTSVAHVHAIVLREDIRTITAFRLLVTREYAESVWEDTVHAGQEFHLCSFGLAALQILRD